MDGDYRTMGDAKAFRAQLLVPEQRQLFDYWTACAREHAFPSRQDIKPFELPRLLPGMSLIDVNADLQLSTVRLAGTRLREVYDREITGSQICDLDWEDKRDYWLEAYKRVVQQQLPAQGIVKAPRRAKDHMVQYWLKLPLGRSESGVSMVLCYDYFATSMDNNQGLRHAAGI
jgi:hypothetical protein